MTDIDRFWSFQPPDSAIYAQLILRGETPEIVTEGVTIAYAVEKDHAVPSSQVDFWTYTKALTSLTILADTGLSGNTLSGRLQFDDNLMAFHAEHLPVVPFRNDGSFNPYPRFRLEARDKDTGELLAQTSLVTPVSTEMGCKKCHGNAQQVDGRHGMDDHTAQNILAAHDRIAPRSAWTGQPDCLNCHVDFEPPETDQVEYNTRTQTADQLYSRRTGDAGLMCMACHGAAHAIYPARNPYGEDLDNLQPLQYQGTPYPIGSNGECRVCHTIDMEDEIHHPNMLGEFRNTR